MATSKIRNIFSKEVIETGLTLYRILSLRILVLNGYQGQAYLSTVLNVSDRPTVAIYAPITAYAPTNKWAKAGRMTVRIDGVVYRGTWATLNADVAISDINPNDLSSGIAIWSVS